MMDHLLQYLSAAREEVAKYVLGGVLLAMWYGFEYWPFTLMAIVVCVLVVVLDSRTKNSRSN
jgi:hypothetical protein